VFETQHVQWTGKVADERVPGVSRVRHNRLTTELAEVPRHISVVAEQSRVERLDLCQL
jgi:hypothetical protein